MTGALWAAVPVLAVIAVDDLRHARVRNRDVLALAGLAGVTIVGLSIDQGRGVVVGAAVGGAVAAAPLAVAAIAQPARMGGGDVKLAAVIGVLLGPISPWLSLATVAGALVLTLAVATLRGLAHAPLAPPLALAATALLLPAVL